MTMWPFGLLHETFPALEFALLDEPLDLITAPSVLDNLRVIEPVLHVFFLNTMRTLFHSPALL